MTMKTAMGESFGIKMIQEEPSIDGSKEDVEKTKPLPPPPKTPPPPPKSTDSDDSSPKPFASPRFSSRSLRSNLTREQHDRDPLFFYETVKTLGVGSMGSVARVKKRVSAVGGSARKDVQDAIKRQKWNRECLQIPLIGGLFKYCINGDLSLEDKKNKRRSGRLSNLFNPKEDLISNSLASSTQGSINGSNNSTTTLDGSRHNAQSDLLYAMKSIHLTRVTDEAFVTELKNEIDILKKLDHPHIVRAIETFEHRNQIFIIMELCSGGDLYSRDPYTEEEAARIVSSTLSAIAYMHSKNVVHRDLKYENILFVNNSPKAEIKLIDFGLSKIYGDNTQLTDGVGTIYTMAPEVLKGNYSQKADVWSVGVVAYMLLSSQMPFYGRKRRHIVEQILNCQFDFRGRRWKRISDQAKAFVEDLLVLDPEDRCDAQNALSSTWLNRRFAATIREPHAEEENMARHAMLRYAGYTKLKKMALMVVAHKSSTEEIGILRKVFQKYDSRRDGSISYEEFCDALRDFGHSEDDLQSMFEAVDLDGTGRIRYTEFLAATIEAQGAISEERLAEAFDRLDCDDSGFISAENLAELLGRDFPREDIDEIIAESKLTKDNRISYSEFLHLWEDRHERDRNEHLRFLGEHTFQNLSEIDMCSFRGSSNDFQDDLGVALGEAEARASFIMEKHGDGKKVGFSDTVVEIKESHSEDLARSLLSDESIFDEPPLSM